MVSAISPHPDRGLIGGTALDSIGLRVRSIGSRYVALGTAIVLGGLIGLLAASRPQMAVAVTGLMITFVWSLTRLRGVLMVVSLAVVVYAIVPASPGLSTLGQSFHPYLVFGLVWFVLVAVRSSRTAEGTWVAGSLIVVGLLGASGSGVTHSLQTWVAALVLPMLFFVGLQISDEHTVHIMRESLRSALFFACSLSLFFFLKQSGSWAGLFPNSVFQKHYDLNFWKVVGEHVLGNPNNASVIFATGFAWALAEYGAVGQQRRSSLVLLVVSGLAVWTCGSRGATIVCFILVVISMALRFRGKPFRSLSIAALGAGALVVGFYFYDKAQYARIGEADLSPRWESRLASIPAVLQRPFGVGPGGTVDALHAALDPVFGANNIGATSHDLFLNWGATMGWVGLLILFWAIWGAFTRGGRTANRSTVLPLVTFLVVGESAGIDLLNTSNPAWAVTLWLLIGLGWRGGIFEPPIEPAPEIRNRRWAAVGSRKAA